MIRVGKLHCLWGEDTSDTFVQQAKICDGMPSFLFPASFRALIEAQTASPRPAGPACDRCNAVPPGPSLDFRPPEDRAPGR
jgi:hypothetical protein